ncbi:MAG TPA: UvrD-helicase domain-containing protein [Nocardioidaceae bacterium]|nr:UvrD-helicase domain-containing protein [Nocardioidaceae bacterium]
MTRPVAPFDLRGPLPSGTTVLEASAGTGKTYTIAGLAARYLAEGVATIDEMMLVTFGRAATAELREVVRERLVGSAVMLANADEARRSADDLVRYLADGTDDEVAKRHQRLATAVANFDAATIATTHGFCHQMLSGLGIAADVDSDATFSEATGDLVADVVSDLFVGDYGRPGSEAPLVAFSMAQTVGEAAVGDPAARLEPEDAVLDSVPGVRVAFAQRVRSEVARRKRSMRLMDYDDLLLHLRDALTDPETGDDACARIRSRYRIVLVDEFQDTDPVQWQILERTFHGHRTLVLIGDPKQAIYAFRGADVVTYLLATERAESESTLGMNWRSDRALVDALRHVMGDVALGDPRIVVHEVDAAQSDRTLLDAPSCAPLRIRAVPRSAFGASTNASLSVKDVRPLIARDVAADIVALLSSPAHVVDRGRQRAIQPADVAVLVQRNEDGRTVRDALARLGVPVVLFANSSVFSSAAAEDWLTLLSALEQPHRPGLSRSAALTVFMGWTAEDLARADEDTLDGLSARLRSWAEVLADRGVAALLEVVVATCGLVERVLAREDGERDLTDLRHVGNALHEAAAHDHGGVAFLVEWLQHRKREAEGEVEDERSRRLDSDAKAVQVLTVHRSKGLEYPVVYVPYLWNRYVNKAPDTLRLHDDAGARLLDVGGATDAGYDARLAVHAQEDLGESLRAAYVALTRARAQVITYWAPTSNTASSPLHRLLFGTRADGVVADKASVPADDKARKALTDLALKAGDGISIEVIGADPNPRRLPPPAASQADLSVRAFERVLDGTWARTSYSGITAGLHELAHSGHGMSEPEAPGTIDESDAVSADEPSSGDSVSEDTAAPVSPMADLPAGAAFGTLVHGVLEDIDFAASELRDHVVEACSAAGAERFLSRPPAELADALLPALHTPLGPLAGGRRLIDVPLRDRLNELDFELPLAGGDVPTGHATVTQVAGLLREHLPADDLLAGYADDLDMPLLGARRLRGFLAGSIDTVLRVQADDGTPRYLVVDYKTNWLGSPDVPLTAWQYRPEALTRAMRSAHYPLQALLYSVALHRYLRWRQHEYRPEVHLGGVLYLFLRGMCGPDTPVVDDMSAGVFSWAPSAALVIALSDLLDGGTT